jgi:hypothetical protein
MFLGLFLMTALLSSASNAPATPTIKGIIAEGNSRAPANTLLRLLSETPNPAFDPVKPREDLQ